MRKVALGRRPIKRRTASSNLASEACCALARDLLITAHEMRHELAEVMGFLDDLEAQARRVARLGGGR